MLTDGRNGIPIDHPTRVIREDPKQPGLLYVGTEFAAFVSFDAGKHFQSLQQNLPNTPVTDIKVHRNDLVVSTMGRSLWIMDDITPLQQLAAMTMGGAAATGGHDGGDAEAQAAGGRAALPAMTIFQPRETIRYRNSTSPASSGEPEYPLNAAHFDLYFQSAPPADAKLEVTDAKGQALRTWTVLAARAGGGAPQGRGPFRQASGSLGIRPDAGMQRLSWDLRYTGP